MTLDRYEVLLEYLKNNHGFDTCGNRRAIKHVKSVYDNRTNLIYQITLHGWSGSETFTNHTIGNPKAYVPLEDKIYNYLRGNLN